MALKSLFRYIKTIHKKELTFEEKIKAMQLIHSRANEMRSIISSINTNSMIVNEVINRAEPHMFQDKKVLTFTPEEYEALYDMLNSLNIISVQGIKTLDHILLLLERID